MELRQLVVRSVQAVFGGLLLFWSLANLITNSQQFLGNQDRADWIVSSFPVLLIILLPAVAGVWLIGRSFQEPEPSRRRS